MAHLGKTGLIYLWSQIKNYVSTQIANLKLGDTYQKKETGKGLSTNDYTTEEKTKLNGIASGAEVNVQANWAESDSSEDSYIKNKPSIPSKTSELTNDSGFITGADVPEGAAASATVPLMDGTAAVGTETAFARGDHRHPSDTSKQDTISDLATIRSGAEKGATAYQKPATGIPKSDLADDVKTALNKAGSAIQEETDPVFSASPAAGIKEGDITAWNGKQDAIDDLATIRSQATAAIPASQKGAANGVCPLDANSKIDSQYLPSYMDDVVEAYIRSGQTALSATWLAEDSATGTVITPEKGVVYIILNGNDTYRTNSEYRWGGTAYVPIYDGGTSEMTIAEMDAATNNWT